MSTVLMAYLDVSSSGQIPIRRRRRVKRHLTPPTPSRRRPAASSKRCDFTSRAFTSALFAFCLDLTKTKIETDLLSHPVPQIGPLVMDVRQQRRTVIERVLELRLPDDVTLDSNADVDFLLDYYIIPPKKRRALDSALADIYLRAVRRLIVAADIQPNEIRRHTDFLTHSADIIPLYVLRRESEIAVGQTVGELPTGERHFPTPARDRASPDLNCSVADIDLVLVFPLPVIGEMFAREQFAQRVSSSSPSGGHLLRT